MKNQMKRKTINNHLACSLTGNSVLNLFTLRTNRHISNLSNCVNRNSKTANYIQIFQVFYKELLLKYPSIVSNAILTEKTSDSQLLYLIMTILGLAIEEVRTDESFLHWTSRRWKGMRLPEWSIWLTSLSSLSLTNTIDWACSSHLMFIPLAVCV